MPIRRSRTLRYRFKDAKIEAAEEPFEAAGREFNRGSFMISGIARAELGKAAAELGLKAVALGSAPSVKTHPARAARVALMHTWINTQDEGWWRLAFDQLADSVHVHQHAGSHERHEPAIEVRRHPVSAGRPRQRARRSSTACRCTATRFRGRRPSSRRISARSTRPTTCARAWAGRAWRTCRSSSGTAACSSPWTTRRTSPSTTG